MSSDPNTPDFDSMSPEEMMAWMESLAKRQGADEGFTTDASVEIAEVDPDTVDESILNQEYRPDGWTEERWQAQLEKEKADREARIAARQASQSAPPPVPEPEPEPEPIPEPEPAVASQPAMNADGTPDYDNMTPEQLMEWMESLAKRQGADEGFTTKAEMEVAEIDPNTVDESILNQEYRPEGWTEERWQAQLAKEEAQRQAKSSRSTPAPEPEPILEPELVDDDDEELATINLDDLPTLDLNDEETQAASENPMDWLSGLAATDEESEELDIPDLSGLADDFGGLEALAQDDDDSNPMDWLASLAGDVDDGGLDLDLDDMSSGLEGLEAFAMDDDDDDEDESLATLGDVGDPVSFLDNLARIEGAPEDELSTDASQSFLDDLESMATGDRDGLDDTQPSEELDLGWATDDPSSIENPEAWLDALAHGSSGDDNQLPMFEDDDDDDILLPDDDTQFLDALHKGEDLTPEDVQSFFESQFKKAEEFSDLDEDFDDDEDEAEIEAAVAPNVPDWLQELGQAPADLADDEEEDIMADVLADLESQDVDEEEEAEQVGIPDWLNQADEEEEAEQVGIPDWLSPGAEDDTGNMIADIIADELDIEPGETALIETSAGPIEVDPSDTWTQAFLMENREEDAEKWYNQRLTEIDDDSPVDEPEVGQTTIGMTNPPGALGGSISLEPASLPVEEELAEGQPELAPEWLTGVASQAGDSVPEFDLVTEDANVDIPSWLEDSISDDDDIDIPDWLSDDDDSSDDSIPDWLSDAGVSDVEPATIPDWLTDTVEEPVDVIESPEPESEPQRAAIIQAPPPAADVSGAIKSAQEKVSAGDIDEALQDYESVVRANDSLDIVINDLQKLANDNKHKKNPAVYRTLGDALMRHGDLQDALDTYRRALNLL